MTLTRKSPMPRQKATRKAGETKLRTRKCAVKGCGVRFAPRSITHKACGPEHAQLMAAEKRERDERKAAKDDRKKTREALIELKPRKWWLAKAKKALHALIRAEAEGKPCISCDTILINTGKLGGDYDAGHFRSVGSAKHLEFEPKNIFGQCKHCNDALASNPQEYERRLRILKGDAYVDEILSDQAPRHLTIEDFQRIETESKAKLKLLRANQQGAD